MNTVLSLPLPKTPQLKLPTMGKHVRLGVILLFGLIIVAGAWLSIRIAQVEARVSISAKPLVTSAIPKEDEIAHLQGVLFLYQAAISQYQGGVIGRDEFVSSTGSLIARIDRRFRNLQGSGISPAEMQSLNRSYAEFTAAGRQLVALLSRSGNSRASASKLFEDLTRSSVEMRGVLRRILEESHQSIQMSSADIAGDISEIRMLVHIFVSLIAAIVVFAGYHLYARMKSDKQLHYRAWHDVMTGLKNRHAFEQALHELQGKRILVTLISLDRFERITNSLGYGAGDLLLKAIGAELSKVAVRRNAQVFRLDGANFAAVYDLGLTVLDLPGLFACLQESLQHAFAIGKYEVFARFHIGADESHRHSTDVFEVLRNAETALLAARRTASDTPVSYSLDLDSQALERLTLEADLAHALDRQELVPYFQPQLDLHSGKLLGFETLIRWQHAGRFISPASFIPLAEESGLIIPIGAWILDAACRQARDWNANREEPLTVAVNISVKQFQYPGFLALLNRVVAETKVDPAWIELEITEGVALQDVEHTLQQLDSIHQLGFKLSIDDFGTGYSNLSYLSRFPLDRLKIDQSFVRNLQAESKEAGIVRAVIELGHSLGLNVIAEGVETREHVQLLQGWGCDELQGYFYGRPLPQAEASAFIANAAAREECPSPSVAQQVLASSVEG
ncbi:putative bifunctional diguanylate cyclase/phosphodiesterase [Chitinimonas naiadis]